MHIILKCGRKLSYDLIGEPDGFAVFYFHGGNGSSLEAEWFEAAAQKNRLNVIATDRPGFGHSAPEPKRTLKSWARDIAELADHLNLDRICLIGLSGGGPHALAVAHELQDRVAACAIVSSLCPPGADVSFKGMFPMVRLLLWSANWFPALNRLLLKQMQAFYASPEKMRAQMLSRLPGPDRDLLEQRPDILDVFARSAARAHRQGLFADAQEWQLYVNDWGFDPAEIQAPVTLWYGQYDVMVPVDMGRHYSRLIKGSTLHIVEDGAHFSTINNHFVAIADELRLLSEAAE